jgi:hypothetical protein
MVEQILDPENWKLQSVEDQLEVAKKNGKEEEKGLMLGVIRRELFRLFLCISI